MVLSFQCSKHDISGDENSTHAMAARYGQLQEFKPGSDSINAYLERASLYFAANDVADGKKVPVLLSSIGAPIYAVLSDLLAPEKPGDKSFDAISTALCNHFEPKRSVITERFHFHKRDQAAGESISDFDAALRKLATHCQFGDTLQETLRDRFVCGLRHDAIQRRLLSESTLTYKKALEIASGMEAADKDTKSFQFKTTDSIIKKIGNRPPKVTGRNCYRCGRSNHSPTNCKFKDATCLKCGKTGHIAPACQTSKPPQRKQFCTPRQKQKTHHLQADVQSPDETNSSDSDFKLHRLGKNSSEPIMVSVELNGQKLDMEVDTGAAFSVISEATRQAVFSNQTLHPSELVLKTYTDECMKVKGTLNMRVKYGNQKQKLVLVVVDGNGPSLLGRNWLKYLRLDWNNIFAVRTAQMKPLHSLLQRHQYLFSKELGEIHPFTASLHVKADATPRFFKPCPVPFAIKDAISQELNCLEKQGTISPVTHSQ